MMKLKELLEDPQFAEWMRQVPKLPPIVHQCSTPPWRVYVQRVSGGRWAYKDFDRYVDAYRWLKPRLSQYHDFALNCRRISFEPPTKRVKVKGKFDDKGNPIIRVILWKPKLSGDDETHEWCPYCRRPTVFKFYRRHHAFPQSHVTDPTVSRCSICGASERLAPPWHTYVKNPVKRKKAA